MLERILVNVSGVAHFSLPLQIVVNLILEMSFYFKLKLSVEKLKKLHW